MDAVLIGNDRLDIEVGAAAVDTGAVLDACEIALIKDDLDLGRDTDYATLEAAKATYTGYAVEVVTWGVATRADDGAIEYLGEAGEFRPTGTTVTNGIYGMYVRNAAHTDVLFCCRFEGAPLPMESALDAIKLTLRYRPGGRSLAALLS